jgi:hypothetical protein
MAIQRIVCFKFKEGIGEAERKRHLADFKALKAAIPQILSYSAGRTIPGEKNAMPDYDVMHYLTYATPADIQIYVDHPAHRAFVDRNRTLWDKVLVMASGMDE